MARSPSRACKPSTEQLLDREVDALDSLVGEYRGGVRGPGHYAELEERATEIGDRLRAAFREGAR